VEVAFGDALDLFAHRGREEQRVAIGGNTLKYLIDAVGKSHVEHFVGLVEHHIVDVVELCHTSLHQVDESSRRGHDDLHAVAQGMDLCLYRCAAIDGYNMQPVDVLTKCVEIISDLQAQLASGAEDERLCVLAFGIGLLQHGDTVGGCLARSGLSQRDDVIAVT